MSLVINHYTKELTTDTTCTMKGCCSVSSKLQEKIEKRFSVKSIYPNPFTFSRSSSSFVHHQFSPSTSWQLWNVMESLLWRRKESCHPRKTNYTILPPYITAPSPVWLCSNSQIYEFHIPLRKYMVLVEQGHDKRVLINIWMKNHLASF